MTRRIVWLSAVFLGSVSFGVRAGAAPAGVSLGAGDAGRITFSVEFPAPDWREGALGGADYRWMDWTGYLGTGAPGDPALPGRILEVAVPPTGDVRVGYTETRAGAAMGVRFPPNLQWEAPPPSRTEPRAEPSELLAIEGEGYSRSGALPQVESLGVQVERGLRILRIAVRPVAWDPVTGRATWSSRVDVTVDVSGGSAEPSGIPQSDLVGRESWATRLVNPANAAAWTAPRARQEAGIPDRWFDDAAGWAKIYLGSEGVYRLDRETLRAAGVPVQSLDPRTLRMYCGPLVADVGFDTTQANVEPVRQRWRHVYQKTGFTEGCDAPVDPADGFTGMNQIAIWVRGEEDGAFDPGDDVVFYGMGPDGWFDRYGIGSPEYAYQPYTGQTVYWLCWGGNTADLGPAARMGVDAAPPGSDDPVREARARVHAEDNTWYDPSMYLPGLRWEEWFWRRLTDGRPETFRVALPGVVAGSALDGRVRLWGGNEPAGSGGDCSQHLVRVDVNGSLIETAKWGGAGAKNYNNYDVALDAIPASSSMDVRIEPLVCGTSPIRFDLVYLAWIEMTYRRTLDAGGGALSFGLASGSAGRTVAVASPPASPVLLDVTDFRHPRRIGATTAGSELRFRAGGDAPEYRLVGASGLAVPASVRVDARPERWLRDTSEPVDYVIVTADEFEDAADELAAWRRNHLTGLTETRPARVRVVRISDVYDEFSAGMKDASAIRYFLEYAFRYYGSAGDDPVSYAVLMGDHTYDTRDNLHTGAPDFMPSWENNRSGLAYIRFGNVQYPSDDPLVSLDALYDAVPDIIVGRIPVSSASEALAVVQNKIIRSERNPDRGPWRNKAILIADDVCQGHDHDTLGFTHMNQTESIDRVIPAQFDRDKIYLYDYGEKCVYDSKPSAKRDLLASWSEGAWLVNYIGHGADIVLADEHVFDSVDIPLLDNEGRLPVVGTFSCSVGKFSKPLGQGLGEAWVRAPHGGSLASYAATNVTFPSNNAILNVAVMQEMFPDPDRPWKPVTVGAALTNAKRRMLDDGIKYVCLGDPGSRPSVPDTGLELDGPDSLSRGDLVAVTSRLPAGDSGTGQVDLVARAAREHRSQDSDGNPIDGYYRTGAVLFRGRAEFGSEGGSQQFVVPMSLRDGPDGRIRAYAWSPGDAQTGAGGWDAMATLVDVPVGGEQFTTPDQTGPAITFLTGGGSLRPGSEIQIQLEDPAGIDLTQNFAFRGILLKVRDEEDVEQLRLDLTERFNYALGSFTKGTAAVTVPELPAGTYHLVVSAYDNYTNRAEADFDLAVQEAGAPVAFRRVFAYPNPMHESTRLAFGLDRPAQVQIRVFTVAGRLVWETDLPAQAGDNAVQWDGRDSHGDAVANGVYLMQLTAAQDDGSGDVKHLERLVVYR